MKRYELFLSLFVLTAIPLSAADLESSIASSFEFDSEDIFESSQTPSMKRSRASEKSEDIQFSEPKRQKTTEQVPKGIFAIVEDLLSRYEEEKELLRESDKLIAIEEIDRKLSHLSSAGIIYNNIQKISKKTNDLTAMLIWQKRRQMYPYTLFSDPVDTQETKLSTYLTGMIHHARDDIKIACYHLTFFPVAQALVSRKKAGVSITLLTDRDQNGPAAAVNYMKSKGITVLVPNPIAGNSFPPSVHTKFFLFENVHGKKVIAKGSYNPTGNADKNEWNDLEISDHPKTFEQYTQQFRKMKKDFGLIATFSDLKEKSSYSYDLNKVPERYRLSSASNKSPTKDILSPSTGYAEFRK